MNVHTESVFATVALSDRGHWFRRLQWSREQDSIKECRNKLQKYQGWLQLVLTPEGRLVEPDHTMRLCS